MRLNKKASAEGVRPAPVPNGDRLQLEVNDYRQLFESIDQGFCVIEVIFGDSDQPIDYRFLDVNPAFEHQTGLRGANGSLMRDFAPDHEDHWFEIYGRIAKTGTPEWFTNEARQLGRWFDVYAFRVGEPSANRVAVLFNDITERRGVEELSRQAAERDRFRVSMPKRG
ncbi:MAG: PAS domain-containing protein, partial [Acidimicrobiia bacterium]